MQFLVLQIGWVKALNPEFQIVILQKHQNISKRPIFFNVVPSFDHLLWFLLQSSLHNYKCTLQWWTAVCYHQFTFKFVMENHSPVPGFEPGSTMDQVHEADDIPMGYHASIPRMPNTIAPNLWQHLLYWHAIRFGFI